MPSPSALPSSSTPPTIGRFDEHQVWTNGHERTIENSARGTRASSFSSSFFLGLDHWVILSLARARLSFTFPPLSFLQRKGEEGGLLEPACFSSRYFSFSSSHLREERCEGKKEKKRKMLPNFVNSFEPFLAQFDDSRNFGGKLSSRGNRSDRNHVGEILFFLSKRRRIEFD